MTQDATVRILGRAALGAMLAAVPVAVAIAADAQTAPATDAAPAAPQAMPAPVPPADAAAADQRIEARIRMLHDKLKITPAQEQLWGEFTAVMKSNADRMRAALEARQHGFGQMDAVSDLRSYADLTAERSRGIEALVGPFGALYAALSPEQKQAADATFRHYTERAVARQR